MLDDATVRADLERHWKYAGRDEDIAHEICHADAVLEFHSRVRDSRASRISGSGDVNIRQSWISRSGESRDVTTL